MLLKQWNDLAPKPQPLSDGDEWNVFLSYRSINRSWVLNLYDVLKQIGHKVFLDQYELKPGDKLILKLEEALNKSQAGILIWSTHSADSEWVLEEYQALQLLSKQKSNFQFIPVKLDKTKVPLFAQNKIFLDFASYPDGPNGGELLRLLYAVVGKTLSTEAVRFANDLDEASMVAGIRIEAAIKNGLPKRITQLYNEGGIPWEVSSSLGCKAAEGLTKLGENEEAILILENLINKFPKAIRPKQLLSLALARRGESGDLELAQQILGELYSAGERDPETLGIYGRTWMDRFNNSDNVRDLRRSRDLYVEAFTKAPDDYYTGVNATAKSVFLGTEEDLKAAEIYASQVQTIVGTTAWPEDYWKTATVAEILMIRRDYEAAAKMYQSAIDMCPTETGSHGSTWKQANKLMDKLKPEEAERKLIQDVFCR
ncbi:MAG: toll/interleukin receptor protein [Bacteroidota bacterium]|nr:toll/interleukin receptor protein [Bacteroidota bacterium]